MTGSFGTVELRDGKVALLRALRKDDRARIAAAFERLSPDSRYRRFFRMLEELSERELTYLTEIDHRDHEAIVALDPQSDEVVGVARYVRSDEDPTRAEAAVAVADDWQGRGLGRALLERLSERAREEEVERFTALVQADNRRAVQALSNLGPTSSQRHDSLVELDIELPREGLGTSLAAALRGAASAAFGTYPLAERILRKAREVYLRRMPG